MRSKLEPLLECTALYSGCTVANYHEIGMKLSLFPLAMHVVHNPQRNTSTVLYNNAVQQYCSVFRCTTALASPLHQAVKRVPSIKLINGWDSFPHFISTFYFDILFRHSFAGFQKRTRHDDDTFQPCVVAITGAGAHREARIL